MRKIVKVSTPILHLEGVHSLGVIGDPGCEGLGAAHMKVYAGALEATAQDDLTLVVGDLVPAGTARYYEQIQELTEILAQNNIYSLRGNHDTGAYTDYFGLKNYALLFERFALVVLDNALRTFEEDGLSLLREVLDREDVKQVIVAFHIPVPNHFIQNCVSEAEFARLRAAYGAHKDKVKYLLCGHVHSRFVDEVDDIPLLCTGGGGAMIEDVSKDIRASDIEHHVIHFREESGILRYEIADLPEDCYSREWEDSILRGHLEETVQGELKAHFQYLMFAGRAKRRGFDRLANLFEALAASEYHHARNFYTITAPSIPFTESAEALIPGEQFEYQHLYKMLADFARSHNNPLSQQAYTGAAAAEKIHAALLEQAADLEKFSQNKIYVCPICGYVMTGDEPPERCPICGGPAKQYEAFCTD